MLNTSAHTNPETVNPGTIDPTILQEVHLLQSE